MLSQKFWVLWIQAHQPWLRFARLSFGLAFVAKKWFEPPQPLEII